ncbi:transglycosylase family protein [Gordonia humi]|uniref:transglycosylase family protein n=1 Tax=Gordonia humi TaxID=686429 RepID=UPI00360D0194
MAEQLFPSLVQIVGALLPVIVQVIGILTQLVGVIMPILIPAIQLLGAIVGAVFSAAATAIQWAVDNVISPALQWFSDRITDAKSIVGGAVDWIVDKWNTAVDFFKGLPGRIGDALSGMWDGLKDGFRSALNWLIEKWNNFGLHWSFTIPVINKTVNFDVDTPDLPMFASGGRVPMLPGAVAGKDSILAGIMPGEYITPTKRVTPQTLPLLEAIRAGWTPSAQFLDSMFNAMPGFADGGGYGLPTGTSIGYGGSGFPDWVNKLAAAHGVQPSTYPGHQESDRNESGYAPNPQHLNRGIDFSGSVEAMQGFAEALMGQAPSNTAIEQIIWQNPSTGQQLGWHGRQKDDGSYFAADYSGHQDHVHLRASGPVGEGIGTSPDTAMDGAQTASSGLGSQFTGKTSGKLTAEYEQGVPTLDEAMKDKTLDKVFVVNMPSSFNFAADTTGSTSSGSTSSGSSTSTSSTTSSAPSTVDTIPLKKNDDGTYSSTDPEWDHLIQRESGGKADIVQQVQDANSGGNEASGLFQIAKGTWDANGGTKYAPTAGQATPEQQAEIAAAIFNDQGGAPWGSGLAGRENDDKLRAGIQRKGAAPAGTPTDPVAVTTTPDSTTTIDTPSTPDTAATTTPESTPADESMLTRWMREQFEAVVGKPTTTAQATTTASLSKDDELALTVGQSFADHTPLGIGSGQFALAKSKAPAVTEIGAGIAKALPAWGQALAGDPAALIANVGGATAAWGAKTATDFAAYLPEAAGGMFESLASAVAGPLIGTVNTGMSQDQLVSTVEDVQNRQLRRSKTGRRRY